MIMRKKSCTVVIITATAIKSDNNVIYLPYCKPNDAKNWHLWNPNIITLIIANHKHNNTHTGLDSSFMMLVSW